MLDRTIRNKREKLKNKAIKLREVAFDLEDKKKTDELRSKQEDTYKKWKFYDNLIKSIERVEKDEVQAQKRK